MEIQVTEVNTFEGPVHVSFKAVKNTVPAAKYRFLFSGYEFITAATGTPGVKCRLSFDKTKNPEYEKRSVYDNFWFTPNAINLYLSFIMACGIQPEMLREQPVEGQFNEDGTPVTACVYSTDEQLKSIFGAVVYGDLIEEQYDGMAADGVTPERKWRNSIATRGYSKA